MYAPAVSRVHLLEGNLQTILSLKYVKKKKPLLHNLLISTGTLYTRTLFLLRAVDGDERRRSFTPFYDGHTAVSSSPHSGES